MAPVDTREHPTAPDQDVATRSADRTAQPDMEPPLVRDPDMEMEEDEVPDVEPQEGARPLARAARIEVGEAPVIDGDLSDLAWAKAVVIDDIRPGGFIIADNVLWSGKVLAPGDDENAIALHEFNQMVKADERVSNVLLPVRDGLMVVCKLF